MVHRKDGQEVRCTHCKGELAPVEQNGKIVAGACDPCASVRFVGDCYLDLEAPAEGRPQRITIPKVVEGPHIG